MRIGQLLGVILILAGVFILWRRPTYPTRHDVVKIGDFQATMDQEEAIPAWWGAAAAGAGVVLLLAGSRQQG